MAISPDIIIFSFFIFFVSARKKGFCHENTQCKTKITKHKRAWYVRFRSVVTIASFCLIPGFLVTYFEFYEPGSELPDGQDDEDPCSWHIWSPYWLYCPIVICSPYKATHNDSKEDEDLRDSRPLATRETYKILMLVLLILLLLFGASWLWFCCGC